MFKKADSTRLMQIGRHSNLERKPGIPIKKWKMICLLPQANRVRKESTKAYIKEDEEIQKFITVNYVFSEVFFYTINALSLHKHII